MENKIIKRLRILFKSKRRLLTVSILGVFIIQIGYSILLKDTGSTSIQNILTDSGSLEISKTVAKTENQDEYEINFNITGHPAQTPKVMADIVIMVDGSSSMRDKLASVKSSIKSFCSSLIGANADVKIAIGEFSSANNMDETLNINILGNNEKDSSVICNFQSDINTLNLAIDGIQNKTRTTNIEAGIYSAGQLMNGSREGAKKYVVFFTDGLPRYADGQKFSSVSPICYYDSYFKAAQIEYNYSFGLFASIKSVGGIGVASPPGGYWDDGKVQEIKPNISAAYKDVKFYTIGVTTGSDVASDKKLAIPFLYTIQNVATTQQEYENKYYGNDATVITTVFNDISNEVNTETNKNIALNSVIKDKVSEEFTIPDIKNLVVKGLDKSKVSIGANNEITFNIGNIQENGIAFSFRVKSSEPYFSGNAIETNGLATINYNDTLDPNGEKKTQTFNIPTVDIAPKTGTVKIQTVVGDGTDNNIVDKFSILMSRTGGNGSYNFDQTGNSTGTISCYMKNINTNVSKNSDMTMNYLNVGEYSISEIVPIYYQLQKIEVSYDDGKTFTTTDKIIIDKDHKNITIKVTNTKIDGSTWFDKEDISNIFTYVKTQ